MRIFLDDITRERPLVAIPRWIPAILAAGFAAQLVWHQHLPPLTAKAESLPPPPALTTLRLASLDEPILAGKLLMLWLQAFDYQANLSIPFQQLDYSTVIQWLGRILELDSRGQYPLLSASRVYAEVADVSKQRQMLEFVHQQFFLDPNRRWPWLAHAVIVAKHRLNDAQLALKYAQDIAKYAQSAPHWAQQMAIFVLEDIGEVESARVLLGGLLASGTITDPQEVYFLTQRLEEMAAKKP
jgi:hypothetical protein